MSSANASVSESLALGTAQLGQEYGISNRSGQPSDTAAQAVLEGAWHLGVRYLDTAQAYGASEQVIGRFLRREKAAAAGMKIITKLHPDAVDPIEWEELLENSLERLGCDSIWGLLLHRESLLDCLDGKLGETLRRWKASGLVEHLGVSVTSEKGVEQAIEAADMEIVQAPASAFDRRLYRAGLLAKVKATGKTLFVRSVFLQGSMLLSPAEATRQLPVAAAAVERLAAFCAARGIERRRFAVGYARRCAPGGVLVIGSETCAQVEENCRLLADDLLADRIYTEWDAVWPDDDPALVDPSKWRVATAR